MAPSTRDGRAWHPSYLLEIDIVKCVGCGRCFKVCGRGVLELRGVTEDGAVVALGGEDEDELERKVMAVADGGACVGCGACGRVCARSCQTYEGAT
jgi:Nif-specific ferredoxin III